jgi:hypothetical protein
LNEINPGSDMMPGATMTDEKPDEMKGIDP